MISPFQPESPFYCRDRNQRVETAGYEVGSSLEARPSRQNLSRTDRSRGRSTLQFHSNRLARGYFNRLRPLRFLSQRFQAPLAFHSRLGKHHRDISSGWQIAKDEAAVLRRNFSLHPRAIGSVGQRLREQNDIRARNGVLIAV